MDGGVVELSHEEEVRTLFVSGLPMDAKPRELYLLFRAYEGYEGSLLKVTSKNGKTASPVGFVTFNTRAGAEAAKQDLQLEYGKKAEKEKRLRDMERVGDDIFQINFLIERVKE
ncbi:hypothetical protein ABEB36_004896 [Hypothenemus hampei]|uniref:RRM domain-containing protein n=1 Tax=Hypothenemus hampei TaxID=57062 RepID=A0ABD1EW79_HYPHA